LQKWRPLYARKRKSSRTAKKRKRQLVDEAGPSGSKFVRMDSSQSDSNSQTSSVWSESSLSQDPEPDGDPFSAPSDDDMCLRCKERPADMSLEHTKVLHECVCTPCSKELMKLPAFHRRCPLCSKRFTGVIKVFS
jgi:hypothetical protein